MTIDNPESIKFANERARVVADLLCRSYYRCLSVSDRWGGLAGTAEEKVAVMEADIRRAATQIINAFYFASLSERIWFLGVNSTFPNTSEAIEDGSPNDGRPAGTGAKVHTVMSRVVDFQNWLLSQAGSFSDETRSNWAWFNTVLMASDYGPPAMHVSTAGNFINRCDELTANYGANASLNLNGLLAFAVNPE